MNGMKYDFGLAAKRRVVIWFLLGELGLKTSTQEKVFKESELLEKYEAIMSRYIHIFNDFGLESKIYESKRIFTKIGRLVHLLNSVFKNWTGSKIVLHKKQKNNNIYRLKSPLGIDTVSICKPIMV